MTNNSSREDSPKVASSFGDRNIDSSELASMINTESRPFTEPFNIDNGINPEDEQSASNEAIEPTLDTIDNDNTDKMFSDSNIETTETSQNNEEDGRKEVESNDKIPIEQEEEKEEEYQNYDDVMKVDAEALAKKELEAKAAAQALENANSLKKASSPEPEDDEEEAEYAEYKYDGFHSDIINSDLTKWSGKKYMGGYKDKRTNTEYFHAITQTITAHEIRAAVFITNS